MAVENGTNSYMPPATLRKFEKDIAPLLSFLASSDDYVIVENEGLESFVSFWNKYGFNCPNFISLKTVNQLNTNFELKPWGWSQIVNHQIKTLVNNKRFDFSLSETKQLFSRHTSLELVAQLNLNKQKHDPFLCVPPNPTITTCFADIETLFNTESNGIVLKTLYSSSGRGLAFIKTHDELCQVRSWVNSQLKQHGYLLAETLLDKVQDASFQFHVNSQSIEFLGLNFFDADDQGRFLKEHFETPESVKPYLPDSNTWLNDAVELLTQALLDMGIMKKYEGPIGIDAMFFKDKQNKIRLQPCIEANMRCNMGLVNLYLKKRIHTDSKGFWQIHPCKKGEAKSFFEDQIEKHPIEMDGGLIRKGFIPLSPFSDDQQFVAWGMVK